MGLFMGPVDDKQRHDRLRDGDGSEDRETPGLMPLRPGPRGHGQSIAFTSFALCLIVAAFECRSETTSILTANTFDSEQMNWKTPAEPTPAVLAGS
jgi:hypothetical protein